MQALVSARGKSAHRKYGVTKDNNPRFSQGTEECDTMRNGQANCKFTSCTPSTLLARGLAGTRAQGGAQGGFNDGTIAWSRTQPFLNASSAVLFQGSR